MNESPPASCGEIHYVATFPLFTGVRRGRKKRKTEGLARQGVPRRGRSRREKEIRQRLIVEVVIIVAVVAALAIVGYGYYASQIKPWHQPIVRVNDTVFDINYFVKMLRLYGLDSTADASSVESVVTTIENNELLRQEAERRGLYPLNATEVDNELKELCGFDPGNQTEEQFYTQLETNLASYNVTLSDLKKMIIEPIILQDKLQAAMGNDTYPQVQVQAILLATKDEAEAAKIQWGNDFNQLVKEYSPSRYWPEGGYWVIMVTDERGEGDAMERHVEGILLVNKEKAEEVASELYGGGNFTQLVEEYSLDADSRENGGDLGWLSSGNITSKFGATNLDAILALGLNVPSEPIASTGYVEWLPQGIESSVFDGFAFNSTAVGVVSDPIRDTTYNTTGGYWIIEVLDQTVTDNETEWHVQGILLDSSKNATDMRKNITNGGNFTQLANDNSLDTTSKASGGDLGWLTSANITSEFGADNLDTILALEPNVPSEPIYSATVSKQSGYWLINVLNKQDRTLSENDRSTVISNAYNKWLEGERTGEGVKNYLDPEGKKIAWALAHL